MSERTSVEAGPPKLVMLGENPFLMRGLPFASPTILVRNPGEEPKAIPLALTHRQNALLREAVEAMLRSEMSRARGLISRVEKQVGTAAEQSTGAPDGAGQLGSPRRFVEPLKVRAQRAGRPRKEGPRHDCGKLKPPEPNSRVVEIRRALLGAQVGEVVDISQAENALDLALARGWITADQRKAADGYAALLRRVLTKMPRYRAPRALSDLKVHSQLQPREIGLSRSGVLTDADQALVAAAADLEAGRITLAEYHRIDIAHRRAKIDWSRLPREDFGRIWDAMADSTPAGPVRKARVDLDATISPANDFADAAVDQAKERLLADLDLLRGLWEVLTDAQCRELMAVCVLMEWPGWITMQLVNRPVARDQHRRWSDLQSGLDRVFDQMTVKEEREAPPSPAPLRPVRREEYLSYVDEDGHHLFDVVRKVRA